MTIGITHIAVHRQSRVAQDAMPYPKRSAPNPAPARPMGSSNILKKMSADCRRSQSECGGRCAKETSQKDARYVFARLSEADITRYSTAKLVNQSADIAAHATACRNARARSRSVIKVMP